MFINNNNYIVGIKISSNILKEKLSTLTGCTLQINVKLK